MFGIRTLLLLVAAVLFGFCAFVTQTAFDDEVHLGYLGLLLVAVALIPFADRRVG